MSTLYRPVLAPILTQRANDHLDFYRTSDDKHPIYHSASSKQQEKID